MTTPITLKLSDLAPGDVAVFVYPDGCEGDPFAVEEYHGVTMVRTENQRTSFDAEGGLHPVRRLGRGRLVPARIEMQGEPAGADDTIRDLRRKLAEAGVEGSPPPGGQGTIPTLLARTQDAEEQVRKLRKALQLELVSLTSIDRKSVV